MYKSLQRKKSNHLIQKYNKEIEIIQTIKCETTIIKKVLEESRRKFQYLQR